MVNKAIQKLQNCPLGQNYIQLHEYSTQKKEMRNGQQKGEEKGVDRGRKC